MDATAFGQPLVVDHLPEGFVPLEAVVIVKGLLSDGDMAMFECSTEGLSTWEALGMTIGCADALRRGILGDEDD